MSNVTQLLEMILEGSELDKALDQVRAMRGKHTAELLLEPLLEAAKKHRPFYRRKVNAIYALGELGERRAVDLLFEILKEGASQAEADEALQELLMRGPIWMSERNRRINTELPEIRAAAAVALGLIGDRRALQPLIDTLQNDWAWVVRAAAAFGLGELGDESAVPVLKVVLKTEEEDIVRKNAQKALDKLKKAYP